MKTLLTSQRLTTLLIAAIITAACQPMAEPQAPSQVRNPFQDQPVDLFNTCDDELKRQLINLRTDTHADHFNQLVGHMLINRTDCLERH